MAFRDLPEKGYQRVLVLLLYGLLALCGAFLFFRFLWKPVLPFLLAALLAMLLQKPLEFFDRLTGRRRGLRRMWAILLVLVSAGTLIAVLFLIGNGFFSECREFVSYLGGHVGTISQRLDEWLWDIRGFLTSLPGGLAEAGGDGVLFHLLESTDDILMQFFQRIAAGATAKIPLWIAAFVAALPRIFLFLAVFLIASSYFTMDFREIGVWLVKHFPNRMSVLLSGLRSSLVSTLWLYARAYGILIVITFLELYLGFLVLSVPYALGVAAIVALIDLLPVIGTGTVLVPWAVFSFLNGETGTGVGLLLLYGVIALVRQIIEPRIVGGHIGLHPLLALFSMYAGAKLFGLAGLFLVPFAAAIGLRYSEERQGNNDGKSGFDRSFSKNGRRSEKTQTNGGAVR